jgi:hypothetical protein
VGLFSTLLAKLPKHLGAGQDSVSAKLESAFSSDGLPSGTAHGSLTSFAAIGLKAAMHFAPAPGLVK